MIKEIYQESFLGGTFVIKQLDYYSFIATLSVDGAEFFHYSNHMDIENLKKAIILDIERSAAGSLVNFYELQLERATNMLKKEKYKQTVSSQITKILEKK